MRRRVVMGLMGGAVAWPFVAWAQQKRKWRIGFLHPGQSTLVANRISALREGLKAGYGEEVEILARVANERPDQLPAMAADLIKEGVDAICAVAPLAVRAAHEITRSVDNCTGFGVRSGCKWMGSQPCSSRRKHNRYILGLTEFHCEIIAAAM